MEAIDSWMPGSCPQTVKARVAELDGMRDSSAQHADECDDPLERGFWTDEYYKAAMRVLAIREEFEL